MSKVRNLIRTDAEHFELEVDTWIRKIANPMSLFVVDMSAHVNRLVIATHLHHLYQHIHLFGNFHCQ